jgi:V/A-type H+-transporting ATPase subunit D
MAKLRLTKNELKKQKDSLKRFLRYLPTLQLKKQQLQMEIRRIEHERARLLSSLREIEEQVSEWIHVFGEDLKVRDILTSLDLKTDRGNIAGIDIPIFSGLAIEEAPYDLFDMPLWVDSAVEVLKKILAIKAEAAVLNQEISLLADELRITSQRVNLFEKVKIPEANEIIRMIRIFLGDQQTAAVVRGKISKSKIVKAS